MKITSSIVRRALIARLAPASTIALAFCVAGCAVHRRTNVSSLFIKRGTPTVSFDDPASGAQARTPARAEVDRRQALASAAMRRAAAGPAPKPETIERSDARLAESLAGVRRNPTAYAHLAVASDTGG